MSAYTLLSPMRCGGLLWKPIHTICWESKFFIFPYVYTAELNDWCGDTNNLLGYEVAGIRLDIYIEGDGESAPMTKGNSSNPVAFMKIIEAITYDMVDRGYNVFLYNDFKRDSPRKFSIYRRIAQRVASKLDVPTFSEREDLEFGYSLVGPLNDKQFSS